MNRVGSSEAIADRRRPAASAGPEGSTTCKPGMCAKRGYVAQHSSATYPLFAHIPGLQVVLPSGPAEAAGLLLSAIASDEPTLFIETKPLYEMREAVDLPVRPVRLGQARIVREGSDITFVAV